MSRTFKVGDRVRLTSDCFSKSLPAVPCGSVGVVSSVIPNLAPWPYYVSFAMGAEIAHACSVSELEIAGDGESCVIAFPLGVLVGMIVRTGRGGSDNEPR